MPVGIFTIASANHSAINDFKENRSLVESNQSSLLLNFSRLFIVKYGL